MADVDEREVLRETLEQIGLEDQFETVLNREQTIVSPFLELNSLDLSGFGIEELPNDFFWRFPHLFSINLAKNNLSTLAEDAFNKNRKLRELDLNSNRFADLPEGLLKNALHLQILNISGNHLETLPDGFFQRTINLRKLNLADNQLSSLPSSFFKLTTLWSLDLSGNKLPEGLNKVAIDENSVKEFIRRIRDTLGD